MSKGYEVAHVCPECGRSWSALTCAVASCTSGSEYLCPPCSEDDWPEFKYIDIPPEDYNGIDGAWE